MTNIDKAAQVIDMWIQDNTLTADTGNPHNLARELADSGLLTPELPEPSAGSDGALLWHNETVWIEDDEVAVYTDLPKSINWMTPNEARNLAYVLLSAAQYAEEA